MDKFYCNKHEKPLLCMLSVRFNESSTGDDPAMYFICPEQKSCGNATLTKSIVHECPKHSKPIILKKYIEKDDNDLINALCAIGRAEKRWCYEGKIKDTNLKLFQKREKGQLTSSNRDNIIRHKNLPEENKIKIKLLSPQSAPTNGFKPWMTSEQRLYGGRMTKSRVETVSSATSKSLEKLHQQILSCPKVTDLSEDPDGLNFKLMDHQKHALAWMQWREKEYPSGGILADDMGLGKTLTIIALVLKDMENTVEKNFKDIKEKCAKGTLVVCPASVVHQWNSEVERHVRIAKRPSVVIFHGPSRDRQVDLLTKADIVLTTYALVAKSIPSDVKPSGPLFDINWKRIVLDEGHTIRNFKTDSSKSVCLLSARHRWVLTGTPIQNNLLDMYALLKFLRFSPFDEYELWKRQVQNYGTKRLNIIIKTLMLRRTKQQKNEDGVELVPLPQKTIYQHKITLSEREKNLYDFIFNKSKNSLMEYLGIREQNDKMKIVAAQENVDLFQSLSNKKTISSTLSSQKIQTGTGILTLLLRLRQSCCHGNLLKNKIEVPTDDVELDIVDQMHNLSVRENATVEPDINTELVQDLKERSSKIDHLLNQVLLAKKNNERCVVISQWTTMLDIVGFHLKDNHVKYASLTGSVTAKNRCVMVEQFNSEKGVDVLLLSLQAGGVGLNLIGANHLFFMDIHWNPALEMQAADRIYRFGQKRNVFIHRYVCLNTVEEKIIALQEKKKTLAENVLTGSKAVSTKLTMNDLKMIFGLEAPKLSEQKNYSVVNF